MAAQTFQQEYMQMPPITRAYTTACVLTTVAIQLDVITPFQIYFNPELIFRKYQIFGLFVNIVFLGSAFTIMLVYVWSRRNPYIRMNFFGLMTFHAPYLPWVLLGFSVLLGNSVLVDLMGIAVGHVYYFLEDVFPKQKGGFKLLKTPGFLKYILEGAADDPNYNPLPEDRPGGFNWGEGQAAGNRDQPNQG